MTRLMLLATVIVVAANAYAASWQSVPPSTFTDTFAPMFTARCKQSRTNQGHGSTADLVYTCAEGWIVSHYTDAQINAFVEAHDHSQTAAAIKAYLPVP